MEENFSYEKKVTFQLHMVVMIPQPHESENRSKLAKLKALPL